MSKEWWESGSVAVPHVDDAFSSLMVHGAPALAPADDAEPTAYWENGSVPAGHVPALLKRPDDLPEGTMYGADGKTPVPMASSKDPAGPGEKVNPGWGDQLLSSAVDDFKGADRYDRSHPETKGFDTVGTYAGGVGKAALSLPLKAWDYLTQTPGKDVVDDAGHAVVEMSGAGALSRLQNSGNIDLPGAPRDVGKDAGFGDVGPDYKPAVDAASFALGANLGGGKSDIAGMVNSRVGGEAKAAISDALTNLTGGASDLAATAGKGVVNTGKGLVVRALDAIPAPVDRAAYLANRALTRDGMDTDALRAQKAALDRMKGGIEETAPELGGKNLQGLTRALASTPGEGAEAAQQLADMRREGLGDQAGRALAKATGQDAGKYNDDIDAIIGAREKASKGAYDTFYQTPVKQDVFDAQIRPILDSEPGRDARAGAVKGLALKAQLSQAAGRMDDAADYANAAKQVAAYNPGVANSPALSPRALDYVKRSFQDLVDTASRDGNKHNAGLLAEARRNLAFNVDTATDGAYSNALGEFSGPTRIREMIDVGYKAINMKGHELDQYLRGSSKYGTLTNEEMDGLSKGLTRAFQDGIDGNDRSFLNKFLRNKTLQAKLESAIGDKKKFTAFKNQIVRRMGGVKYGDYLTQGSPTARIAAEQADAEGEDFGTRFLGHLAGGGSVKGSAVAAVIRPIADKLNQIYRVYRYRGISDPEINQTLTKYLIGSKDAKGKFVPNKMTSTKLDELIDWLETGKKRPMRIGSGGGAATPPTPPASPAIMTGGKKKLMSTTAATPIMSGKAAPRKPGPSTPAFGADSASVLMNHVVGPGTAGGLFGALYDKDDPQDGFVKGMVGAIALRNLPLAIKTMRGMIPKSEWAKEEAALAAHRNAFLDKGETALRMRKAGANDEAIAHATGLGHSMDGPLNEDEIADELHYAMKTALKERPHLAGAKPTIDHDQAQYIRDREAGAVTLHTFGGGVGAENLAKKGRKGPLQAIEMAQKMDKAGADRDAIWAATSKHLEGTPYIGVHKGVDGKWRFEIDDNAVQFKKPLKYGETTTSLGKLVNDADAGKAYPDLKNVRVSVDTNPGTARPGASYGESTSGLEKVGLDLPRKSDVNLFHPGLLGDREATYDPASFGRETLLHERQHAIQNREDFAQGDNPDAIASDVVDQRAIKLAAAKHPDVSWDQLPLQYQDRWRRFARGKLYLESAGETEARNVQARRDMSPAERRAKPPWTTADIPEDQQRVQFGFPGDQRALSIFGGGKKGGGGPPTALEPSGGSIEPQAGETEWWHAGKAGDHFNPDSGELGMHIGDQATGSFVANRKSGSDLRRVMVKGNFAQTPDLGNFASPYSYLSKRAADGDPSWARQWDSRYAPMWKELDQAAAALPKGDGPAERAWRANKWRSTVHDIAKKYDVHGFEYENNAEGRGEPSRVVFSKDAVRIPDRPDIKKIWDGIRPVVPDGPATPPTGKSGGLSLVPPSAQSSTKELKDFFDGLSDEQIQHGISHDKTAWDALSHLASRFGGNDPRARRLIQQGLTDWRAKKAAASFWGSAAENTTNTSDAVRKTRLDRAMFNIRPDDNYSWQDVAKGVADTSGNPLLASSAKNITSDAEAQAWLRGVFDQHGGTPAAKKLGNQARMNEGPFAANRHAWGADGSTKAPGREPPVQNGMPDPTDFLAKAYGAVKEAFSKPDDPRRMNAAAEVLSQLPLDARAKIIANARAEVPRAAIEAGGVPEQLAQLAASLDPKGINPKIEQPLRNLQTKLVDTEMGGRSSAQPMAIARAEKAAKTSETYARNGTGPFKSTANRLANQDRKRGSYVTLAQGAPGGLPAGETPVDRLRRGIMAGAAAERPRVALGDEDKVADMLFNADPAAAKKAADMAQHGPKPWVSPTERNVIRIGAAGAATAGAVGGMVIGAGKERKSEAAEKKPPAPTRQPYTIPDRMVGTSNPHEKPPELNSDLPDTRRRAQQRLVALGYASPTLRSGQKEFDDGEDGVETRAAVRKFQAANDLPVTGDMDPATLRKLWGGKNYTAAPAMRQYGEPVAAEPR